MGIQTLRQGGDYVISSDRGMADAPTNRPPKGKPATDYYVWTGDAWSSVKTDAMTFATLDAADDHVKANYRRLSGT